MWPVCGIHRPRNFHSLSSPRSELLLFRRDNAPIIVVAAAVAVEPEQPVADLADTQSCSWRSVCCSSKGSSSATGLAGLRLADTTMSEKVKHPKVPAAKRGCLSARQWQDIRQASRLARTEGVTLHLHGVRVGPTANAVSETRTSSSKPALPAARDGCTKQQSEADAAKCARDSQLSETNRGADGSARASPSSKRQQDHAQRSQKRLQEFQERKRMEKCQSQWLSIGSRYRRTTVWTSFMRETIRMRDDGDADNGDLGAKRADAATPHLSDRVAAMREKAKQREQSRGGQSPA